MKVTEIKTFICDVYRTNWVLVKLLTDEGIYGVGEATLEHRELTVLQAVKEIERYVVGTDPSAIEKFWWQNYRDAYWRGGPVLCTALSAVEMAMWDIKGKLLGVPIYQLLGGKVRDSIPCYANGWFAGAKTPEQFAEKAKKAVEQGFKGLKWDPFGSAYLTLSAKQFSLAMECIEAVRASVGENIFLFIEGHGRLDIPTAFKVAKSMEKFDIAWFEEPIPPGDLLGLAELKQRINIPIAAGERLYTRWDYKDLFASRAADFIQPDISHCGGILEIRKIAAMAECHYIPICPHNPIGAIANAATLQIAACTPNFYLLETMINDIPYRFELTTEKIILKHGEMKIPDSPGLGIDIKEENFPKYPYTPHNLRHYNGNLTDIRTENAEVWYTL